MEYILEILKSIIKIIFVHLLSLRLKERVCSTLLSLAKKKKDYSMQGKTPWKNPTFKKKKIQFEQQDFSEKKNIWRVYEGFSIIKSPYEMGYLVWGSKINIDYSYEIKNSLLGKFRNFY